MVVVVGVCLAVHFSLTASPTTALNLIHLLTPHTHHPIYWLLHRSTLLLLLLSLYLLSHTLKMHYLLCCTSTDVPGWWWWVCSSCTCTSTTWSMNGYFYFLIHFYSTLLNNATSTGPTLVSSLLYTFFIDVLNIIVLLSSIFLLVSLITDKLQCMARTQVSLYNFISLILKFDPDTFSTSQLSGILNF